MKIVELKTKNFKILKGEHSFKFNKDIIFFVGENNTGKTTVLEAINYLINGPVKDKKYITNGVENGYVSVELKIEGNFADLPESLKKYEPYISEEKFIRIKRTNEESTVTQNGKNIKLDQSKIQIFNPNTDQFENPTGKDTTFKNFIDTVFVWSDTMPDDVVDFGSTKILGKLVKIYSEDFFNSEVYREFKEKHREVFHDNENSLQNKLKDLSQKISTIFNEQYGDAEINFSFELVDDTAYVKNGAIIVKEKENEDKLNEKGSGMQRSIALSIIQLFSNINDPSNKKRLLFCIDEPELNLHPRAQEKLIKSLIKLSENTQVFISTHSPYILNKFNRKKHKIFLCKKEDPIINPLETIKVIEWGPIISEINYFAYNIISKDYYNDLYAYLEYLVVHRYKLEKSLEKYLVDERKHTQENYIRLLSNGDTRDEKWTRLSITRHKIHHQENKHNGAIKITELKEGIDKMIKIIKEIQEEKKI